MAIRLPFRGRPQRPTVRTEPQPDDVPKRGLFTEPVRLDRVEALEGELLDDGRHRATFLVEVRDAEGRRCPDLFVEAEVSGPERSSIVSGTTDLFGRLRFRMAGPAGTYRIEVRDVAAGGLAWDRTAHEATAVTNLP